MTSIPRRIFPISPQSSVTQIKGEFHCETELFAYIRGLTILISDAHNTMTTSTSISRAQGTIIILLLFVAISLPIFSLINPNDRWEYQVLEFAGTGTSRTGKSALDASTIQIDGSRLKEMGNKGWEMVDTLLEIETAFPNFGASDYVTGLRENIRPQKAIFIFKRRAKWFERK